MTVSLLDQIIIIRKIQAKRQFKVKDIRKFNKFSVLVYLQNAKKKHNWAKSLGL